MPEDLDWELPYPSRRAPVFAKNMVTTAQPLAAQAGLRMLLHGGNAVDAALATAIALAVVEPVSASLGADAFALIWDGAKLHGLNASGRSPRALDMARFELFEKTPEMGWDSVTVPGCVSAWAAMSKKFGRLPFRDVFQPAIEYARDGFHLTPTIARQWRGLAAVYKDYPEGCAASTRRPAPGIGDVFSFREQADTFEVIADTHGEAFYAVSSPRRSRRMQTPRARLFRSTISPPMWRNGSSRSASPIAASPWPSFLPMGRAWRP